MGGGHDGVTYVNTGGRLFFAPLTSTWYQDLDGDGYGDAGNSVTISGCDGPAGYVEDDTDCNPANPTVHPGGTEVSNGIDDNCNGLLDEDAQGTDTDGDGIHNACDNCIAVNNSTQENADHDLFGDACDTCTDTEGDGYGNPGFPASTCVLDNCPFISNAGQGDSDGDGMGDACDPCPNDSQNDIDTDGVCGNVDNCPSVANGNQLDTDNDGRGDACDNCYFESNSSQADRDHDGEGDICDLNDGLIYIYSTNPNYREWQAAAGYTTWNSYRGSLSVLRATGQYTQVSATRFRRSSLGVRRSDGQCRIWAHDVVRVKPGPRTE